MLRKTLVGKFGRKLHHGIYTLPRNIKICKKKISDSLC